MTDRIQKALDKMNAKEMVIVKIILQQIKNGDFNNLDIKKLKGRDDVYRARKGKMRILYRVQNGEVSLLTLERRNDNTYN